MSQINKLFVQFSHFFTGGVLGLLFGLITFPILTRVLTREQYGIMGLVSTTMLVGVAIAKGGLSDGVIRFYKEYSKIPEKIPLFCSTVLVRGFILSALTALIYLLVFPILNRYLKVNDKDIFCFMIMAIYLFIRPLNIIITYFLRVNDKTLLINALGLGEKMMSVGFSLFLLVYVFHELYGFFVGVILAEFIGSVILFRWFFKRYKMIPKRTSKEMNLKLLKFGFPLLLSELSFLFLSNADKYIIIAFCGEAVLGLYLVGYTLASYVGNIVMFSLSYAITPIYVEIYEKEGKEKTEEFLRKSLHYLMIAIIPMCVGYFAVSKELFVTLASEKYSAAATFSPIILVGSFFLAITSILNAGLYLQKKTMIIFLIILTATVLNISLNLILLPRTGVMGAAIVSLITCLSVAILTAFASFRYINLKIEIGHVLYYLMLSLLMYYVVSQIDTSKIWMNLGLKVITGIIIVGIGIMFREKEVLRRAKETFRVNNPGSEKGEF
jgi:O-antigen/teichoic acid export membrane protein